MIISVNWLKKFTSIDSSIDELATLIGSRLVEIEEVIDLGKKYEGVIVAKVVECHKLEGSDHLNVAKIDDGGVAQNIERDENGYVQVVCGAPNVREGLLVAWLPPNSTVPATFNDDEPFVLGARKLRGVLSNGMIASAKELDLFDEHDGILEIDEAATAGTSFAKVYDLNDYLLDIENKSLTHRPDAFGIIGFAREVAAIQGNSFETPSHLTGDEFDFGEKIDSVQTPNVTIEDPTLSSRYQAIVIGNIDAKAQSDIQLQSLLSRSGVRPVSAIVDITNYLMLQTAQPLHAFDYDKLKAVNDGVVDMRVRAARTGETLALLDGRTLELSEDDIIITNGNVPVSLAGAMGGAETEVDDTTHTILLESAAFNLYNLRNTQMRHGIFSEAITRVTKGQPAEITAPVLAAATREIKTRIGGVRRSDVAEDYPDKSHHETIKIETEYVNQILGTDFTGAHIQKTLKNVEFEVDDNGNTDTIDVTAPFWRADIHIPEDIIEEVGRLNGFDTIEPTLPKRDFTAVSPSSSDQVKASIRHILTRSGANEVLTYSFVHGDLLKNSGQDPANSYRITNSISPDLQYYRQSLLPSLLQLVHRNIKAGYSDFALFELNKAHSRSDGLDEDGLPFEQDHLAFIIAQKNNTEDAAFYRAKRHLMYLAGSCNINLAFEPFQSQPNAPNAAPFEYRRSAKVLEKSTGKLIGIVGEFKKSVTKNFKLPTSTAGFVIEAAEFARLAIEAKPEYQPPNRYPGTTRDICFKVDSDTTYQSVVDAVTSSLKESELDTSVSPVDIYRANESDSKNITIRISLVSKDRTLDGSEVNDLIGKTTDSVCAQLSAELV